jgi:hypothetical protein
MNLKINLLILLLLGLAYNSHGQEHRQMQKIKLKALQLCDQYEMLASASNDDQKEDFYNLFESTDIEILNDVLPDNRLEQKLSLFGYTDLISSYFSIALNISFNPYEIEVINHNGEETILNVYGKKAIKGIEERSMLAYADTLDINIKIKYSEETKSCKIIGIELNQEPVHYVILNVEVKSLINKRLLTNDTIRVNNYNYITSENGKVLVKVYDPFKLKISPVSQELSGVIALNKDEITKTFAQQGENKNTVNIHFAISLIEIGFESGMIASKSAPIKMQESINNGHDLSYQFGFNVGALLRDSKKGFAKFGIGFNYMKLAFYNEISSVNYAYNTIDPNTETYTRKINVNSYKEKNTLIGYQIPLYFETGKIIYKKIGGLLNLGVTINKSLSSEYQNEATIKYSGYYPQYYNITLNSNGIYDFGQYNISSSGLSKTENIFIGTSIKAGLYCAVTHKFNVRILYNWQNNISNIYQKNNLYLSNNPNELNTLTQSNFNLKLNASYLSFGIYFKI